MKRINQLLPTRKNADNKSAGGKCLLIGGSSGMSGALVLAATAAARVGAGYVYVYADNKKIKLPPDFLTLEKITAEKLKTFSAIAIGCGLRNNLKNKRLLQLLIKIKHPRVVIDAGSLESLSELKNKTLLDSWIITPHEKEMSRLIPMTLQEIRNDRTQAVSLAYAKYHSIVLLKGPGTLIRQHTKLLVIQTGNKALAKAGTGDVLTGMIAGFLSQGLIPLEAAYVAATIHGLIADEWAKTKDHLSLMASDLNQSIPETIFRLRRKK